MDDDRVTPSGAPPGVLRLVPDRRYTWAAAAGALLAVVLATLNLVGGFVVTDRMLEIFKGRAGSGRKGGGA